MGMPHAYLGTIPLELPTYMDRLDVSVQVDFAEHAKIGQKPRLQWTGDKLDEVQLDATLHAQFCTPEVELAALKDAARKHEAMELIFSNGHIAGRFVLTAVEQRTAQLMRDGTVIVATVSLSLREYTEDGKGTEEPASGTPVAALTVGAGGGEAAPAGTVTTEPEGRAYAAPAVRGGGAVAGEPTLPTLVSTVWLD
jgi:phage protein U